MPPPRRRAAANAVVCFMIIPFPRPPDRPRPGCVLHRRRRASSTKAAPRRSRRRTFRPLFRTAASTGPASVRNHCPAGPKRYNPPFATPACRGPVRCTSERSPPLPTRRVSRVPLAALGLILAPSFGPRLLAQARGGEALRQIAALRAEKEARTPSERKLDTALLYAYRREKGEPMVAGLPDLPRVAAGANVKDGMVVVDVRADVTDELLQAVADLGGSVDNSHPRYDAFRAVMPSRRIEDGA